MRPTLSALSLLVLVSFAACNGGAPAPAPADSAVDAPAAEPVPAPEAGEPAAESAAEGGELAAEPDVATAADPAPPPLLDPDALAERAPNLYRARFRTTLGDFVLEVHRDWSPRGADRFYNLVKAGFYDEARFFRVVEGFVVQFGINGDPAVSAAWSDAIIQDDTVAQSNVRGRITFATGGPNTRTTQVFINLADNANLDGMGFSPFGEVVEGLDVVQGLYSGYGDGAPYGAGPDQGRIEGEGNAYLEREFPRLDYVRQARIEG